MPAEGRQEAPDLRRLMLRWWWGRWWWERSCEEKTAEKRKQIRTNEIVVRQRERGITSMCRDRRYCCARQGRKGASSHDRFACKTRKCEGARDGRGRGGATPRVRMRQPGERELSCSELFCVLLIGLTGIWIISYLTANPNARKTAVCVFFERDHLKTNRRRHEPQGIETGVNLA